MPVCLLLLQGYLPANVDRRPATLQRKQKEYFAFIEHYYNSRNDEVHQDTYRQVCVGSFPFPRITHYWDLKLVCRGCFSYQEPDRLADLYFLTVNIWKQLIAVCYQQHLACLSSLSEVKHEAWVRLQNRYRNLWVMTCICPGWWLACGTSTCA